MIIVLCGVIGSGKSTVGRQLARELGWSFVEGDDFHPPTNVEKMRCGIPLDDADRAPWLDALANAVADCSSRGQSLVVSCSALKRAYRDRLRAAGREIVFVLLSADPALIHERVGTRAGHFAGVELIESQLATLEPLARGEGVIVDAAFHPAEIVAAIRRMLKV